MFKMMQSKYGHRKIRIVEERRDCLRTGIKLNLFCWTSRKNAMLGGECAECLR